MKIHDEMLIISCWAAGIFDSASDPSAAESMVTFLHRERRALLYYIFIDSLTSDLATESADIKQQLPAIRNKSDEELSKPITQHLKRY